MWFDKAPAGMSNRGGVHIRLDYMNRLPPLHALRVFESVARLRSFTAAANELCLTQSAVSHQIKNLEDFFGFPLMERRNRLPELNEAGEQLLKAAQSALQVIATTTTQLMDARRNQIRVKSYPSIAFLWLMPRLRDFYLEHPGIEINLTTMWEETPFLRWDEYDFVIHYGEPQMVPGEVELLHEECITPVCSYDLCSAEQIGKLSSTQLLSHPLIHPTRDRMDWHAWLAALSEVPPVNPVEHIFDTDYMAVAAASRGVGVTIIDPLFVQDELKTGKLVMPHPLRVKTGRGYYLLSAKASSQNAPASILRDWLFRRMRESESLLYAEELPT
ncbi:LysR family transcriptional regulator [Leeia sp. TBRC 13508]|uniref:LysR family transcriptional regulator n=1 Tax=Leeia speluncae TaxID=2884804 RepID=A0ABS8D737_9NEIS|nr:LysR substrate-binding domain-containing protein [Leeia speluncae]MCB6184010.1 LysR family transcriptional regulator [Leeia speluncae]